MVAGSKFDFCEYVSVKRDLIEQELHRYLQLDFPLLLVDAMRYSALSAGKRLRALLCMASAEAIAGNGGVQRSLACACAVELIHTFSLIHDDLPAMDNDDFRRGKPTSHKVFGEAMAILAGDALFSLAMEIILNNDNQVEPSVAVAVAYELARAVGCQGMVGGQVMDMSLASKSETNLVSTLSQMHERKTGALIRFSTWSGAKLAGANMEQQTLLARFGEILGLAFQIADDLLDVTGDIKTLGKTPGKDEKAGKLTWVRVYGVEPTKLYLQELKQEGQAVLAALALNKEVVHPLDSLLEYAIDRKN